MRPRGSKVMFVGNGTPRASHPRRELTRDLPVRWSRVGPRQPAAGRPE